MISLACLVLAFLSPAVSPEAEGVSSQKLLGWLDACDRKIDSMHGFVFLRHGKVIAEGSWTPFDTLNEPHRLVSHSKCFASTAIGLLVDDGKLDLDERVIDILADKAPANPAPNMQMVRVRDLLTMTLGAKATEAWAHDVAGDWAKAMLANSVEFRPGQMFRYDSGATHLLGAIVERKSGKPIFDFLKERLFDRIGIEKAWTTYDPCGFACAGWGFQMTTREISLMGQLHLNRGKWDGRQLLSEDWVQQATAAQTWSLGVPVDVRPKEKRPKDDWAYGFGFNWWRCQHGCYRADGSGGQYTIVFPDKDAVLSIHSDVNDMQQVLDVVWEDFLPVFASAALPEDEKASAALKARCAALNLPTVKGRKEGAERFFGREFAFGRRPVGIRSLRMDKAEDGWRLTMKTDAGTYEVPVGFGEWTRGTIVISAKKYEALGDLIGSQNVAASAAVQDDGTFKLRLHVLNGPRRMEFVFGERDGKPTVEGEMVGAGVFKM